MPLIKQITIANKVKLDYRGQILVLVAVMMVVMCGFTALAVDVGILMINRAQLTTVADAAALAGAQELPTDPTSAESEALSYASANGKVGDTVSVVFSRSNEVITVDVQRQVSFVFARVLGFNTIVISSTAMAQTVVGVVSLIQ